MWALIFKDFRAGLFHGTLILPGYLFFVTQAIFLPVGFIEGYLLLVLVTSLLPMILESVYSSEITICSLPVSRRRIVHARYLGSLALAVVAIPLCGIHLSLTQRLLGIGDILRSRLFSAAGITIFLGLLLLLLALLLPLTLALGVARGSALFLGTLLLGALLLKEVSGFSSELLGYDPPFLIATDLLAGHLAKEGSGLLLSIWGGLLLGLGVSLSVTVSLYRRRSF